MISPRPVLDEIREGNDEVVEWADVHESAFMGSSGATVDGAEEIMRDHPSLGGSVDEYPQRDRADPHLIALARSIRKGVGGGPTAVIVTEENPRGGNKIPQVAEKYGIKSCNVVGMFKREKWTF